MQNKLIKDTESLITLFANSANSISSQVVKARAKDWLAKYNTQLSATLTEDPKALIILTSLQSSIHNDRLIKKNWLAGLRKIRKVILSSDQSQQNFAFDPNKPFTSYKVLQSLFNTATKEILIYDAYVEDGTLDILATSKTGCGVKILTNNTYGNFVREFKLFKKQFPNSEARKIGTIHDRFFIIDNKAFIIGTSLHSAGNKKYTHIFRADTSIESILRNHFSRIWTTATII